MFFGVVAGGFNFSNGFFSLRFVHFALEATTLQIFIIFVFFPSKFTRMYVGLDILSLIIRFIGMRSPNEMMSDETN